MLMSQARTANTFNGLVMVNKSEPLI
uniref:Uncharacterized protein n=1 Tax=Arundo donax TaxID=35708 RepID=A0A0A9BFA1_ARUDO